MVFKSVMRYSPPEKMLRVARVIWERGVCGDGCGYSAKLSLALRPAVFHFRRELGGWLLTFLGVRVHFQKSFGGRFG